MANEYKQQATVSEKEAREDWNSNMDNGDKKPELTQASFDEAPASATVKIKSANGFEYLFTLRDEKASTLMFKIKAMEEKWMGLGWTPLAQNAWGKKEKPPVEYIQGQVCPQDGGRLIKPALGSKAPIKCENSKWNAQTKQAYGCPYKIWPDQQQSKPNYAPQPIPERQYNEEFEYGGHEGDGGDWNRGS